MAIDYTPEWLGRVAKSVPARFYRSNPPPQSVEDAKRLDTEHCSALAQITQQIEERSCLLAADGIDPETDREHCKWLATQARARRYHLSARAAYQAWASAERIERQQRPRSNYGERLDRVEQRLADVERQILGSTWVGPRSP